MIYHSVLTENSDLGGYQMGPNKKDAVLQTTELLNSVFATAGSYPLEGGYVYVCSLFYSCV